MKSNNLRRRITVMILCAAMTLSYMPASFYAYAQDGEQAASGEPQTEAVSEAPKAEEPKTEVKNEEPEKKEAPQVEEKAEEPKAEAADLQNSVKEEAAAANDVNAAQNAVEEEKAAEEAPAPVKPAPAKNISVKYHFYQLDASGNYVEAKALSRSVSSGKSTTSIAKSTASGYVTNKKIAGDNGMVTEFTQVWKDASGSDVTFPLSMSYEEAADRTQDGSNVEVKLYAQYSTHKESIKVTVKFVDIRLANGTTKSSEISNSIGWGNGWSITKKKFDNTVGYPVGQSFSCNGCRYTYTGQWTDEKGNVVDTSTSISFMFKDGNTSGNSYYLNDDLTLVFRPVYNETVVQGLDCYYIDNISTGSGSWSNKGSLYRSEFSSYTKTFKDPSIATPVEHFRFLYWEKEAEAKSAAERFYDGDKYTFTVDSKLPEGTVTTVKIYAYWQPSVTVNYFVNGELVESKESFDESIAAYGFEPEKIEGYDFTGWYAGSEKDAEKVAEATEYEAPAITRDAVDPKVINLYAGFEEIKKDEPAVTPEKNEEPEAAPEKSRTPKANDERKAPNAAMQIAEAATIVEEAVPTTAPTAEMSNIADGKAPLAEGTWALVNLIATVMAVLGAMIAILRRKEDDEDAEEDDNRGKKMLAAKIAGALAGVAALITFLITEDMSLSMVMIDKWTVLMVIMLAVQIAAAAFNKKASELEDEQETAEEAAN